MEGAGPENLQACLLALGAQIPADPVGKVRPVPAYGLIAVAGIVPDKRPVGSGFRLGIAADDLSKNPAVAEHAGQAGHHALGGPLTIPGGGEHTVHIGTVLRPEGEGLDGLVGEAVALQIVAPGGVLALVNKGEQGVVVADLLHIVGVEDAPGEDLGVLPEIEAVIYDIALEALLWEGAVGHPLDEFRLQTVLPDGHAVLDALF